MKFYSKMIVITYISKCFCLYRCLWLLNFLPLFLANTALMGIHLSMRLCLFCCLLAAQFHVFSELLFLCFFAHFYIEFFSYLFVDFFCTRDINPDHYMLQMFFTYPVICLSTLTTESIFLAKLCCKCHLKREYDLL